ncbi:MAG: TlpA family protein disulfide reductase [Porphyromonadaceae bacterium]|nr:TlpA family protein disulfide reductase [Porphyromonadaceae bacterium]
MKKFAILLLLLCGAGTFSMWAASTKIAGKITLEKEAEVNLFFVKTATTGERNTQKIEVTDNRYEITVDDESPFFGTLYGIITTGEGTKRQATVPLYIDPRRETIRLDVDFSRKSAPQIDTDDEEIAILSDYNALLYTHYISGEMNIAGIRPFLDRFSIVADSLTDGKACAESVKEYLRIWAYIQKLSSIGTLQRNYRENPEGQARLREIQESLPAKKEVLDNEVAILFYDTPHLILQSLDPRKSIEERLSQLRQEYTCTALRDKVEDLLLDQFIQKFDYSQDVDAGYERLQKMTEGKANSAEYLDKFLLRTRSAVGAAAPDVVLLDKEGKEARFTDFAGKYIYVDFWASWCVPCVKEIPYLQELEKTLQNDQVVFVAISLDENKEAWKKKMEDLGMEGNQFVVQDHTLANMLNIKGIPFYVIFDKEGKLNVYNAPRPSTGAPLKDLLESLK